MLVYQSASDYDVDEILLMSYLLQSVRRKPSVKSYIRVRVSLAGCCAAPPNQPQTKASWTLTITSWIQVGYIY